jgi:hypothetical protein
VKILGRIVCVQFYATGESETMSVTASLLIFSLVIGVTPVSAEPASNLTLNYRIDKYAFQSSQKLGARPKNANPSEPPGVEHRAYYKTSSSDGLIEVHIHDSPTSKEANAFLESVKHLFELRSILGTALYQPEKWALLWQSGNFIVILSQQRDGSWNENDGLLKAYLARFPVTGAALPASQTISPGVKRSDRMIEADIANFVYIGPSDKLEKRSENAAGLRVFSAVYQLGSHHYRTEVAEFISETATKNLIYEDELKNKLYLVGNSKVIRDSRKGPSGGHTVVRWISARFALEVSVIDGDLDSRSALLQEYLKRYPSTMR